MIDGPARLAAAVLLSAASPAAAHLPCTPSHMHSHPGSHPALSLPSRAADRWLRCQPPRLVVHAHGSAILTSCGYGCCASDLPRWCLLCSRVCSRGLWPAPRHLGTHVTARPALLPAPRSTLLHRTPASCHAVEAFDPRLNAWVPKASMQQARAYGAAAFAEGALWVIGGMQADGYQYNHSFER